MFQLLEFGQAVINFIVSGLEQVGATIVGVFNTISMQGTFLTAIFNGMPLYIQAFASTVLFFSGAAVVIKIFPFVG